MARNGLTTTQRGLGAPHQRRRKQLISHAYGQPCPYCQNPMLPGQALDFDHSLPRALGGQHADRFAHRRCNQLAGAKLGARLRWGIRRVIDYTTRW